MRQEVRHPALTWDGATRSRGPCFARLDPDQPYREKTLNLNIGSPCIYLYSCFLPFHHPSWSGGLLRRRSLMARSSVLTLDDSTWQGQVRHDENGKDRIDHVGRYIYRTRRSLGKPFFHHYNSPRHQPQNHFLLTSTSHPSLRPHPPLRAPHSTFQLDQSLLP